MAAVVHAIVNPNAASRFAATRWRDVRREFREGGYTVHEYFTKYPRHAYTLAREAASAGAELLVSVGGDGTFNEIVNGLLELKQPAEHLPELGIISVGTGSDLARTFAIPADFRKAVAVIREGRTILMDVGCVAFGRDGVTWQRHYANVMDVGLGGKVVRIANHLPKHLGGFLTFLLSSLIGLATFQPLRLRLRDDMGHQDDGSISIVGAANGRFFGGGMHIAPMARIDDGLLNVLYVKDTTLFTFIRRILVPVYQAGHLGYARLRCFTCRKLEISGDEVFLVDIDGEEEKAQEVTVTVKPAALRIRVPQPGNHC